MENIILKKNLNFQNELCDYLKSRVKQQNKKKLAVVFDIDDTLIYTNTRNNLPIKKVYDLAVRLQIPIFIVTARILNKQNFNYTYNQLINSDFKTFKKLFLMPINYWYRNGIGLFKFHMRKKISQNHQIILNIGDQWTDLFPYPTQIQKLKNEYYIFLKTNEGILVKLKSLV